MARGRRSLPLATKRLEGNRGKTVIPDDIADFSSTMPVPPKHVRGYALQEWNRLGPGLHELGLLFEADVAAFATYCCAYGTFRAAQEAMNKLAEDKGDLYALIEVTQSGNVIQNPLVGTRNKAMADLVKFAGEFGLTPAARARIATDRSGRSKRGKFVNHTGGSRS